MNLTDREKEMLKGMIDRGEPLPPRYRLSLFADAPEVELIWQGKTSEVTNVVLPFQSIEQIDEPRTEAGGQQMGMFSVDAGSGRQASGWTNKLIWGDNKLVLSSLKNGPLRREIEAAGGLKLIYIDPPFDVGADFSFQIEVGGGETIAKEPSIIEDIAYRDTWGRGADSYASMMHDRLKLIQALMAEDASIYVHVGPNVSSSMNLLIRELFDSDRVMGEIVWQRATAHENVGVRYASVTDRIIFATKSDSYIWNKIYQPYAQSYLDSHYALVEKETGRRYTLRDLTASMSRASASQIYEWRGVRPVPSRCWAYTWDRMDALHAQGKIVMTSGRMPRMKLYLDDMPGVPISDLWNDVTPLNSQAHEDTQYETQKPEALLDRILSASSKNGDLVADFFCGSGTTLAVAEKLGRKWIGCDLGRFAIHTSRKRLIGVQRQLKSEGKAYRAFEILNLGKYERQFFVGIDPTLPEEERIVQAVRREEQYLSLILSAYKAERVYQIPHIHGRKGSTLVQVGPIDAPVTLAEVNALVEECRRQRIQKVDILAFEFEMGLHPYIQDEARQTGVTIGLKHIPKDVFDKRAVERGQVQFFDVAYVEVTPEVQGRTVTVTLTDFGVFYGQDEGGALAEAVKPGGSKVVVENGQVVKLSRDKQGDVTRDVLTRQWSDWIDYWAVDFAFESKPEILRLTDAEGNEREVRTGNYIFENEWQSFRTKRDRRLELTSIAHAYPAPGTYKIAVKVIDIFGNDTTKVCTVEVGG